MNKTITFLFPVLTKTRCLKRLRAFKNKDYNEEIFSFERDYYSESKNNKIDYNSLGKVNNGKILKRIISLIKSFYLLMKNKKKYTSKIIYVFSFDLLIATVLANFFINKKTYLIYEVGDIHSIFIKHGNFSRIMRVVEQIFLRRVDLIVTTSPAFKKNYFLELQKVSKDKVLVLENKIYPCLVEKNKNLNIKKNKKITIGYFGMFRSNTTWELLYGLAKEFEEKFDIYLRGFLSKKNMLNDFYKRIDLLNNIVYEGEYKYPDDLNEIYNKIDICIIGNMSEINKNHKWALPNRLYEAQAYNVPLLVHQGTELAKRVKKNNLGWILDFNNKKLCINKISKLSLEDISIMKSKLTNITKNKYDGTNDHKELIKFIENEVKMNNY